MQSIGKTEVQSASTAPPNEPIALLATATALHGDTGRILCEQNFPSHHAGRIGCTARTAAEQVWRVQTKHDEDACGAPEH